MFQNQDFHKWIMINTKYNKKTPPIFLKIYAKRKSKQKTEKERDTSNWKKAGSALSW